jgi:DNA polymerase III alpha subunit
MNEVLGLGANIYRKNESDEMPSGSNRRIFRLAADPKEFPSLLEMSNNAFEQHKYNRVKMKLDQSKSGLVWLNRCINYDYLKYAQSISGLQ